ncbi:hypothetical protein M758_10G040300 [Ceratodon purpureus]|nr:hypothetical protein M758_10G040300 [Ceratodon purpureus]
MFRRGLALFLHLLVQTACGIWMSGLYNAHQLIPKVQLTSLFQWFCLGGTLHCCLEICAFSLFLH